MRQGVSRRARPHQRFGARERGRGMANRAIQMGRTGVGGHTGIGRGGVFVFVMPRVRGLARLRRFMLAIGADRSPGELRRHPGQQENDEEFAHGRIVLRVEILCKREIRQREIRPAP